jgi:hypothetical protein
MILSPHQLIAASAEGSTCFLGRDMRTSHAGMGITKNEYVASNRDLAATLDKFKVPEPERRQVMGFIARLEPNCGEIRERRPECALARCTLGCRASAADACGERAGSCIERLKVIYLAVQLPSRARSVRRISSWEYAIVAAGTGPT